MARCRAGDATAWSALVQRFQRVVYAVAMRAGLDEHGAADVIQTAFSRLLEHLLRQARDPLGRAAPPPGADADNPLALTWALKALCYEAWSTEPPPAVRAAEALRALPQAEVPAAQQAEIAALAGWTGGLSAVMLCCLPGCATLRTRCWPTSAWAGDEIHSAFLTGHLRPCQEQLRAALAGGEAAQVLWQLERVRARALEEQLADVTDATDATDDDTRALRDRLSWLYRRVQRLQDEGSPTAILDAELRSTERELLERARRRRLQAAANPAP